MTRLVVDASAAAAWVIDAQRTVAADLVLDNWTSFTPVTPYVFALETRWLFLRRERREKIPNFARDTLKKLDLLRIDIRDALTEIGLDEAFTLAIHANMGFYDAMYLLLAEQMAAPLVTRDGRIVDVATARGLTVIDVR